MGDVGDEIRFQPGQLHLPAHVAQHKPGGADQDEVQQQQQEQVLVEIFPGQFLNGLTLGADAQKNSGNSQMFFCSTN